MMSKKIYKKHYYRKHDSSKIKNSYNKEGFVNNNESSFYEEEHKLTMQQELFIEYDDSEELLENQYNGNVMELENSTEEKSITYIGTTPLSEEWDS